MAYVSLESGIGGSVLIGGSPYHGTNQRSCEFGHMCVVPGGLPCSCGKHGCLEAYCSSDRVSKGLGVSLTDFFDALEHNDPEYSLIWSDLLNTSPSACPTYAWPSTATSSSADCSASICLPIYRCSGGWSRQATRFPTTPTMFH